MTWSGGTVRQNLASIGLFTDGLNPQSSHYTLVQMSHVRDFAGRLARFTVRVRDEETVKGRVASAVPGGFARL